jgi:hypothetical protein
MVLSPLIYWKTLKHTPSIFTMVQRENLPIKRKSERKAQWKNNWRCIPLMFKIKIHWLNFNETMRIKLGKGGAICFITKHWKSFLKKIQWEKQRLKQFKNGDTFLLNKRDTKIKVHSSIDIKHLIVRDINPHQMGYSKRS